MMQTGELHMSPRQQLILMGAAILLMVAGFALYPWVAGLRLYPWVTTPNLGDTYEPIAVGINHQGYRYIKLGMTLAEVEKILGKPAGYWDPNSPGRGIGTNWEDEHEGDMGKPASAKHWVSRQAEITVWFDAKTGAATWKMHRP
jgi:hypothetical protein